MKYWSVLRQCCGSQASMDYRNALRRSAGAVGGSASDGSASGSSGSAGGGGSGNARASGGGASLPSPSTPPAQPPSRLDDPDCGLYDLAAVERRFLSTQLARAYPGQLWLAYQRPEERIRPGLCAEWQQRIRAGLDANGRNWSELQASADAFYERLRVQRQRAGLV